MALAKPKPREIEIMVWNPYRNQAQIGKASVVSENIAIARNNYNNAVAANIAGGPFGAGSYMLNPKGGGFAGAAVDGVAMSFGGIPAGESGVFPKFTGPTQGKVVPYTEMPLFPKVENTQLPNQGGVLNAGSRSLQHMFSRHAGDFGFTGNWNKTTAQEFENVVRSRMQELTPILGTYRGTQQTLNYFNPTTRLNIMTDLKGNLIGGWKLSTDQSKYLLSTGDIK